MNMLHDGMEMKEYLLQIPGFELKKLNVPADFPLDVSKYKTNFTKNLGTNHRTYVQLTEKQFKETIIEIKNPEKGLTEIHQLVLFPLHYTEPQMLAFVKVSIEKRVSEIARNIVGDARCIHTYSGYNKI